MLDNTDRANSVRNTLEEFCFEMFGKSYLDAIASEGERTVIGDFLCSLMHLCHQEGWDFERLVDAGRMHFEEEVLEDD